jgi:hypothetical protein
METITSIVPFILFAVTFLFAMSLGKHLGAKESRRDGINDGHAEGYAEGYDDARRQLKDLINALTVREMLEHKRNKLKGL